ncbi:MAG TPA: hypothetical protein VKU00_05685, partial [Chthonomonadaceae bacterium]|nr:hypothetical protein [Chthonomonadaceae bacterium]
MLDTLPAPRHEARRQRLLCVLSVLSFLLLGLLTPHSASGQNLGGPVVQPPAAANSPTGRNPHLFWTPQRQAVWNQMVAQNHPWWVALQGWASGTVAKYGDIGDYAAIAYQMTGNPAYA